MLVETENLAVYLVLTVLLSNISVWERIYGGKVMRRWPSISGFSALSKANKGHGSSKLGNAVGSTVVVVEQ